MAIKRKKKAKKMAKATKKHRRSEQNLEAIALNAKQSCERLLHHQPEPTFGTDRKRKRLHRRESAYISR